MVEGDARLSEALFRDLESELAAQLEQRRDRLPGLNGRVPGLLQVIFSAPYLNGVNAIQAVLAREGQAGVDALLAELPPSTELLLHPQKLALGEAPLAVEAPEVGEALGEGWTVLGTTTWGEFQLRTMLAGRVAGGSAGGGGGGLGRGPAAAVPVGGGGRELAGLAAGLGRRGRGGGVLPGAE